MPWNIPFRKALLAALLWLVSVGFLLFQFENPAPVMVTIKGTTSSVHRVPSVFPLRDVLEVIVTAWVGGMTSSYLLFTHSRATQSSPDQTTSTSRNRQPEMRTESESTESSTASDPLEQQKQVWKQNLETLSGDEREIYEIVFDAEGYLEQRKIVEESDLSKSTVSRKLDLLNRDDLIERKRRGMGNVVVLTDTNRRTNTGV